MGKHSPGRRRARRRQGVSPFVRVGAAISVLMTAITLLIVLPSDPAPLPASAPLLASQSLSATTPVLTPTLRPNVSPVATTAPARARPARLPVRISAIHIERDGAGQPPVTITETVTVAPAAEEEAVVAEADPETPIEAGDECVPPPGRYDGVTEYVGIIGAHVQERFDVEEVQGKAGREGPSDHPRGLALDFMTNTGNVDGDAIAEYLLDRAEDFNVKYVIWQQEITEPGGEPEQMEDRGSDTANHRDHVHVSFNDEPGEVIPSC